MAPLLDVTRIEAINETQALAGRLGPDQHAAANVTVVLGTDEAP